MYLSKIKLSGASSIQSVADVLLPRGPSSTSSLAQHKLLWAAFSDGPDRKRDFLWRAGDGGVFYTLSQRPPENIDIFEMDVREFSPTIPIGAHLRFQLRANATRTKMGSEDKKLGKVDRKKSSDFRVDVVMDALRAIPLEDRAEKRLEVAEREGRAWLSRQGDMNGFKLVDMALDGYRTEVIKYKKFGKMPQFGVLDLSGVLEVTDPAAFLQRLGAGFGREKSYGCGLMMIQRLRSS